MKYAYNPRLLAAAVALTVGVDSAMAALYESVLQTNLGPIQGVAAFNSSPYDPIGNLANWADVSLFKGVPFAADTSGANRWRPPQPVTPWNTTRDASEFGLACPAESSTYTTGEDCLNLNIWTAASSTEAKLPVILWHHPAGGSNQDPLFYGGGMAAKGVIFVNSNRRDGLLGWLSTDELNEEMDDLVGHQAAGNWGLLDQIAALQWVYDNIAAFGGDPEKITVVGQSAGSAAAYHTVNSNLTQGLFVGAIAESGVRDPRDPEALTLAEGYNNFSVALSQGNEWLASTNYTTIDELRSLALADVPDATTTSVGPSTGAYNWRPTLDGYAIPHSYIDSLHYGPGNDVPFITGNTRDESGATYGLNISVAEFLVEMASQYEPSGLYNWSLALYPHSNSTEASDSYNLMWDDTSRVSSWGYAVGWQSSAKSDVYTYYWDHAPPGQDQGAHHESEINYVFNNLYGTDLPWEYEDYVIAEKMSSYWANFAKTSDPNQGDSFILTNETLVTFAPQNGNETVTFHVGDGWGPLDIVDNPAKLDFFAAYFDAQSPV